MDQGSIGTASCGFTKFLQKLIHMRWDELHRLIRDVKGALSHACGGIFLKAQVFSSFLWGIHARPFGTGLFHTLLQRGLDVFLFNNPDRHSPRFQKYVDRIGRELGKSTSTAAAQDALHESLAELSTIKNQPEISKLGRWFSWNQAAKPNLMEFSAQKMIIEEMLDDGDLEDPDDQSISFDDLQGACKSKDPRQALAQLRQGGGGLQLSYRLMTSSLHGICKIIYVVTQPSWDYYTHLTKNIKNSRQGLFHTMEMATRWSTAPHLSATFKHSLYRPPQWDFVCIGERFQMGGQDQRMQQIVSLSWHIVSERAWSLAARYSLPPMAYSNLLRCGRGAAKRQAAVSIKLDHTNLLFLEKRRHTDSVAKELWGDVSIGESSVVRIMCRTDRRDPLKRFFFSRKIII